MRKSTNKKIVVSVLVVAREVSKVSREVSPVDVADLSILKEAQRELGIRGR
jgi:hypothetical protein